MNHILLRPLAGLALLCAGLTQAQANDYTLNLNGTAGSVNFSSYTAGGSLYDTSTVPLTGLDNTDAISVQVGDVIDTTITFDAPVTVPASTQYTFFILQLSGSNFPNVNTGTNNDSLQILDSFGNVIGSESGFSTTTSGQLSDFGIPSGNSPITFQSLVFSETVQDLSGAGPVTLSSASLYFGAVDAVPEPSSVVLMLGGLAVAGLGMSRRAGTARA